MQKQHNISTWLQTALAVVDTGSPTRAAKQLGTNITTVYRHIDMLEKSLETRVFERRNTGWKLRDEAAALLTTGEEIRQLLLTAQNDILGRSQAKGGKLRLAVPDDMAVYYVAPYLRAFCEMYPDIQPELIVSSDFSDLVNGEADVAIRPDMDPGDKLVGHRVGYMSHAFYASSSYIEQHGSSASLSDLASHQFCGYGAALANFTAAQWLSNHVADAKITARFDTTTVMARAVADGVGIGLLPCFVGDNITSIKAVMKVPGTMPIDIWLITAPAGRKRKKIQAFLSFFGSAMRADAPLFKGRIYGK